MSNEALLTRRGLFMKLGILVNGAVAATLAVPIVRFLLSSITLGGENVYTAWVPIGRVGEFDVFAADKQGPQPFGNDRLHVADRDEEFVRLRVHCVHHVECAFVVRVSLPLSD